MQLTWMQKHERRIVGGALFLEFSTSWFHNTNTKNIAIDISCLEILFSQTFVFQNKNLPLIYLKSTNDKILP